MCSMGFHELDVQVKGSPTLGDGPAAPLLTPKS